MGELLQTVSRVLSQSERQMEIAAQNVANMVTPGYKRQFSFMQALGSAAAPDGPGAQRAGLDLSPGKPFNTGKPLDLAIVGRGFFVVGGADHPAYSRSGQLGIDAEGRLVTASGLPVQADGGGDIHLKSAAVKVLADGTILDQGEPAAKLAIVDFDRAELVTAAGGGLLSTPQSNVSALADASIQQGMLESSNASTADDMLSIMEALRRAETGQRLTNVYDDLMGRVITSVGQAQ